MRRSHKLVLVLGGAAALLTGGIGSISDSHATASPSEIDQLRAQRAALVAELAAMQPSLNAAGGLANSAESAYGSQQDKVLAQQAKLNQLNQQLMTLSQQLNANEATVRKDKQQLGAVIRATWETSGQSQALAAILSASDFQQAMDRLKNATQVSDQVRELVSKLANEDQQIKQEQAQIKQQSAQAQALESQLAAPLGQLLADLMNRNDEFNALNGPARAIAAQIANIDNQIAADEAPANVASGGSCGDRFSFGQCTWYVASRRCVPWGGNADEWYNNAARMGYQVGHTPVVGAAAVWWPGRGGASGVGHVAYVEAVGPADGVPAGQFKISEMNWNGWDRVDYRVLSPDPGVFQGFIYDK
ncbi:MAG: CHAP domain-containing protein [Candidatus Dormibacteria bacterium]